MAEVAQETTETKVEEKSTQKSEYSIPDAFDFNDNPMSDEPKNRSYNQEPTQPQGTVGVDIPEPKFGDVAKAIKLEPNTKKDSKPAEEKKEKPELVNKGLDQATDKEKEIAAEQMADMILSGYEGLHKFVTPWIQTSEKKIQKLAQKNLINPQMAIQTLEGERMTTMDFLNQNNQAIAEVLTHDKIGFDAKVRPAMVREFKKRGVGLTDLQYILIAFGQDIGQKTAMIIGLKKQMGDHLDLFKQMHQEQLEAIRGTQSQGAVNPDQIIREEKPKQQAPPTHEDVENATVVEDQNPPEVE